MGMPLTYINSSGYVTVGDWDTTSMTQIDYLISVDGYYLTTNPPVEIKQPRYINGSKDDINRFWFGGTWVDLYPYTEDELLEKKTATKLDVKNLGIRIDGVVSGVATTAASILALTNADTSIQTQLAQVKNEVAESVKIAKVVTIVIPSGQTAATAALTGFNKVLAVLPVPMWVQDQMYLPGVTGSTNTSVSIMGKRTKGTLILSSGPCESTSGTFQVVVLGN